MDTMILQELVGFLKEVSPEIWKVLIKQVYVEAVTGLLWAVFLAVLCVLLWKLSKYFRKKTTGHSYDDTMYELGTVLSCVFSPFAGIMACVFLISAIKYFINPSFYAIKYLITSLTGG